MNGFGCGEFEFVDEGGWGVVVEVEVLWCYYFGWIFLMLVLEFVCLWFNRVLV